jgi:transposase
MNTAHETKAVESAISIRRVFVAIELSKSTWVVAIQPPTVDKVSLFRIPGGDIEKLFVLLDQARHRSGEADEICACYEAGYDGFWIHRALIARGVVSTVLDSASIQVSRRRRRVKTDRTDAESLVRVLMALYRGEHQVAKIVQVPSPEEEDDKRLLRSRGDLLRDRIRHTNRIRGLLNLQGVRHIDPNRSNWEAALLNLKTGDGRSFPQQLMREIRREAKLLGMIVRTLKEVDAEIAGMIRDARKRRHPAQRGQSHPIAKRLVDIRGVGQQTAGILATEVFYRKFQNRREVASYVGLTPTPYNSGAVVRDQGISKAGNRRARTIAIELAWIWLRNQPESKLSRWFHARVGDTRGRVRRIAVVALARKLIVALWRFLEGGVIPEGAAITA